MAARPFNLIAVSSTTLEGMAVRGGEPRPETAVSRRFPVFDEDYFSQLSGQAGEVLSGEGWSGSRAVLVIPSHQISLRRLEFPFRDPKKIEQALVFELENELLEDVGNFAYTYAIVPEEDEYATVLVYLVPTRILHGYLEILQERQITPIRATFSAQALHQLHAPASPLHYQVYVGADEVYVSCIEAGKLQSVKTFTLNLARFFPAPHENGDEAPPATEDTNPQDLLRSMGGNGNLESEGAPQGTLAWQGEFNDLAGEIMRFIGPHSLGRSYTLGLHGLFASFFAWDEESPALRVLSPGESTGSLRRPSFWGIAEELAGAPETLLSQTGVSFFQSSTGLLQQAREYRRPLAVMGALLLLVAALFTVNFGIRISAQQSELERTDGQLRAILEKSVKGKHSVAQAVRILDERLEKMKRERAAFARFSPYGYETMGLLQDLSGLFKESPQLTLKALTMKGDRFSLSGTTQSYNASESFRNRMAALERFKGSEAAITHQRTRSDITYRIVIDRKAQ